MSTDTYPINPALLAPVEQSKNPPVQISDDFIMPYEVASRLIVCNKISNKLRKRCRKAMQTAVVSRAPILQEMKTVFIDQTPIGDTDFDQVTMRVSKGDRVYDITKAGKTVEQAIARLVAKLNMKQLGAKLRRIPAKRRAAQWEALRGRDEAKRKFAEQRVNVLDEMLDAVATEIERREPQ